MDFYDENEEERLRNNANSKFGKGNEFSNENQQIFDYLRKEILGSNIVDGQPTVFDKKVMKNIPFLGGRPDRDTVINGDDILNLNIAVNTVSTFEDFFQLV